MHSIKVQIEFEVQDKKQTFQCDPKATWSECYDGLSMMRCYAYGRMLEDQEKTKEALKTEETKTE